MILASMGQRLILLSLKIWSSSLPYYGVSLLKILSSKVKNPLNKERGLRMVGATEMAQESLFQMKVFIYTRQVLHSQIYQNISIRLASITNDTR